MVVSGVTCWQMRGLKGLSRLVVVLMTAATLVLMAAVGASAASGTFRSAKVLKPVASLVSSGDREREGQGNHKCKGDSDKHHEATPGHKHHPCDDDGD